MQGKWSGIIGKFNSNKSLINQRIKIFIRYLNVYVSNNRASK